MRNPEQILLNRAEFNQHMEGLLASPRAISSVFGCLVRLADHVRISENDNKRTAEDIGYQLGPGLDGWVISATNLAIQLPRIRDKYPDSGIGEKSSAALETLVENLNAAHPILDTVPKSRRE